LVPKRSVTLGKSLNEAASVLSGDANIVELKVSPSAIPHKAGNTVCSLLMILSIVIYLAQYLPPLPIYSVAYTAYTARGNQITISGNIVDNTIINKRMPI